MIASGLMHWIFYIVIIAVFFSCQGSLENICKDMNGQVRECTLKEEKMIDGIRAIISTIRHFDPSNISDRFHMREQKGIKSTRPVVFLGEDHTKVIEQMENLGYLNFLAANGGGIVLLEGLDRAAKDTLPCALRLLYHVYTSWEWEKLGRPYNPWQKFLWERNENLINLLWQTKDSYDISELNINKLACAFWDSEHWLKQPISHKSLKERNKSMVLAIKGHINSHIVLPVYIIAGYSHMPLWEIDINNGKTFSTKPIYDFFIKDGVAFLELIHKGVLIK